MKQVAVAINGKGQVAAHAGRCEGILVFEMDDHGILSKKKLAMKQGKSSHEEPGSGPNHDGTQDQHHGGGHGCGQHHGEGHHCHDHGSEHQSQHSCGTGRQIISDVAQCKALLCRSAGPGFQRKFEEVGCKVLLIVERDPEMAAIAWSKGELVELEHNSCHQH